MRSNMICHNLMQSDMIWHEAMWANAKQYYEVIPSNIKWRKAMWCNCFMLDHIKSHHFTLGHIRCGSMDSRNECKVKNSILSISFYWMDNIYWNPNQPKDTPWQGEFGCYARFHQVLPSAEVSLKYYVVSISSPPPYFRPLSAPGDSW